MMPRVIIASGGTGGHFYPGFALAQELRARGWQTLFLVKKNDLALPVLQEADFPYAELDMVALPRSLNPLKHAAFVFKSAGSLALARRIMADFKPGAVVGTGSYVAFPALLAARLAGIAAYLHESNAVLGLGNYLAGFLVAKAALGLPLEKNPFASKSLLTGTPIRQAFSSLPSKESARDALGLARDKFTALVFGGSQGAARLNSAFINALRKLKGDLQAVHIAGRGNIGEVKTAYSRAGLENFPGMKLFDYREDMPRLYAAADVVIARAGASTIAELAQLAKPAILVPLPSSAGGHQKANARALASKGAALRVEEGPDFDAALTAALRSFLDSPGKAEEISANSRNAAIPPGLKAAAALADIIEEGAKQ